MFFFFSSRRRHTRSLCDWSSDVCSSDLLFKSSQLIGIKSPSAGSSVRFLLLFSSCIFVSAALPLGPHTVLPSRSEERRVGKECRCGWSQYYYTDKRL